MRTEHRALVMSDSHGRRYEIEKAIEAQPQAKHVFFLGDGAADIAEAEEFYKDRIFHTVRGNCDIGFGSSRDMINLYGKNIFFTHGHEYYVKAGEERLLHAAAASGADIILYGHTHEPIVRFESGVYIINPGSIGAARTGRCSYAVIDFCGGDVFPFIVET